ncbi:MAG: hypothetical protein WED07_03450 [Candidatus Freyarchaeum deiterrae]
MSTVYGQQFAAAGTGGLFYFVYPITAIQPTEPFDFVTSLFFALIVANTLMSIIAPFPNMTQPKRGLINFFLAIITGLIIWGIVTAVVGTTTAPVLANWPSITPLIPYDYILPVPVVAHANVTAFLTFPLVVLLFGQLTFAMWPWSRWGMKGHLTFVILAFIIGAILYYLLMINPGFAAPLTGANLITSASGLQSLYLWSLFNILFQPPIVAPILIWNYWVLAVYFEGIGTATGYSIMYTWTVTVVIFYLLVYEGFEHWPFK